MRKKVYCPNCDNGHALPEIKGMKEDRSKSYTAIPKLTIGFIGEMLLIGSRNSVEYTQVVYNCPNCGHIFSSEDTLRAEQKVASNSLKKGIISILLLGVVIASFLTDQMVLDVVSLFLCGIAYAPIYGAQQLIIISPNFVVDALCYSIIVLFVITILVKCGDVIVKAAQQFKTSKIELEQFRNTQNKHPQEEYEY